MVLKETRYITALLIKELNYLEKNRSCDGRGPWVAWATIVRVGHI
jgi:hypothetical protein